jgi:deoxyribodipyrimidine photo-lyase
MQDAVRVEGNHALEHAIEIANNLNKPLLVCFCLTDQFPEATARHYLFLADGLIDSADLLASRGIQLQVLIGHPGETVVRAAEDACLLVTEYGQLRVQREWRDMVWDRISCPKIAIETNVIVPVQTASPKMDWSAGTFRPKITRQLPRFLTPLQKRKLNNPSYGWDGGITPLKDSKNLLSGLSLDWSVPPVSQRGGQIAAQVQLSWFIANRLHRYDTERNDPTAYATSRMSAYLHFGHISPLTAALAGIAAKNPGTAAFVEQLVIRRELATNFVHYNDQYDQYESAVPDWAKKTLSLHLDDIREYTYTISELDAAQTHDPYWNAMQTEIKLTGYLHGYLRMYWGKKIIEWSETPKKAFAAALYLNNRYQLDGRDPNGFAGIAWCFGRHDRPWKERPILGTIRYMNDAGLKRKFRIEAYRERIDLMATTIQDAGIS